MEFQYNDGGREKAGYKTNARDCVARAIAITSGLNYTEVHEYLAEQNASQRQGKVKRFKDGKKTASHGISTKRKWFADYMKNLGFTWFPTMAIGQGCKIHLKTEELPSGKLVVNVSKHFTSVIDGVLHDTYDCSRQGTRCVYGYYVFNEVK